MRYSDHPTCEVQHVMAGDPQLIWQFLTDISLPIMLSAELDAVEWVDPSAEVAVGNRFRAVDPAAGAAAWTVECEVIEVVAGRRWVWDVHGPDGVMSTWGFELDPGETESTVRQWVRLGPARSSLTTFIDAMPEREGQLIADRLAQLRGSLVANLAAIRDLAEMSVPDPV